jgi:hypothetical protein
MSTNNVKTSEKVQVSSAKETIKIAKRFSANEKNTTKDFFFNFRDKLTQNLRFNQIAVEYYYFPSVSYYLRLWNVPFVARKKGLFYILTVDALWVDYAFHFYAYIAGKGGVK